MFAVRKSAGRRPARVLWSNMHRLLVIAFVLPTVLRAQTVTVTGVAFDSLALSPIPVAFVTLHPGELHTVRPQQTRTPREVA